MVDRVTARTALRERLSETTARAWTDTELNRYLDEGVREVAIRTECLSTTTDIAVTAGVYMVNPASSVLRIHRAEWADGNPIGASAQIYPLAYTQINNLDSARGSGQQTISGTPNIFSTWGYPGSSTFRVVLYPKPQTTGTLRIWHYRLPTEPVNDAAQLDLPNGWEHLVYDYAEFRAKLKDGDQSWQVAKSEFEGRLELFKQQFAKLVDENDALGVDAFYPPNQLTYYEDWGMY